VKRGFSLAALALLLCSLACHTSRGDPQQAYDHVRSTFVHGNLIAALSEVQQASQRYQAAGPEWAWRFRLLQAEILVWSGRNQDVVSLLASEIPSSIGNRDLAVQRHMLLGIANYRLGHSREADEHLAAADRMCSFSCALAGELARARGVVEVDRGHLVEAEALVRKSLDIARAKQNQFDEATALMNLGTIALQQEHFDSSVGWSTQAHDIAQKLGAAITEEKTLGNLGWAYYRLGDFDKSEALFAEAERRAKDIGTIRDRDNWLNTLGLVYYQKNQLPEAEKSYQQSLEVARQIQDPIRIGGAMSTLAFVSVRKGDLDAAGQYCDQAIQLGHDSGDPGSELFPLLVKGQIAAAKGNTAEAVDIFHQVAQESKDDVSLRWEAHNSLARLLEKQQQYAAAEKEYREAVATFEAARATVANDDLKLPFLANATHLYDDYIDFQLNRGNTVAALRLADYSRAQMLAEGLGAMQKGQNPGALNPQQVARKMNGTVLFYWLAQQRSYLWAVTRDRVTLIPLPPAPEIEALVQNYRKALVSGRDAVNTDNADGSKLYEVLVAPAQPFIAANSRVVVLADGALNSLNFETLLVREPKPHYWIEDVSVVNGSSLRLLASSKADTVAHGGKLLLLGDAIPPSPEYGTLPNAAAEMNDVEKHFAQSDRQVYAHQQATAPAYLGSKPEQFAYVHFVAHGTASLLSPLDSAVVLSRATAREDSFKLYARDIIHQPLHANLVTISTCYGAGSRAYTGEGLVGLSWAFLRAGAHNVIGALWEVSDSSTPQLMDAMYDELQKGRQPDEALRAAKLSLLHSDGVYRKPFYWAPFQLYTGS
jgi:CHAT domain-containing protein/Tfp pilus assembly protein PilF